MLITTDGSGTAVLTFAAAPDRAYSVLWKDSLEDPWSKLADVPAAGFDRLENVLDPRPPTRTRFYRVVTPQLP